MEVKVCEAGPDVLVTSREPDDVKAFRRAAAEVFKGQAATCGLDL